MPATAREILNDVFGYPEFRGQQEAVIEHVLAGGECLVVMPTGGGKSLCYQIPALVRGGVGVVVSPLIALMRDQVGALRQLGIRAAFLNSTLSPLEAGRVEARLAGGGLDLLYVAPERLVQERTLALLERSKVCLFAIDEAHCVSQWGHDFRPEYLQLDVLGRRFPGVPRLACTATADERTRGEIMSRLGLAAGRMFIAGFDRPNIQYRVAPKREERRQLLAFLKAEHAGDSGIVYCLSRKRVEQIAAFLAAEGFTALPYHAGMEPRERDAHQERFRREQGLIIVATIAFGMGIDKPDVRFVAHLDLPRSLEAYYQETGRAGRDGEPATAWLVYGLQDVMLLSRLLDESTADERHKRSERRRLEAMLGYCELATCRRQALLSHFGERLDQPCGNCDTCLRPVETYDGTIEAQKLLSCAIRTGQRFGALHLIDVLTGRANERVLSLGHDRLSTFGIGRDRDAHAWRAVIRQLLAAGLLAIDPEGFGSLQVTPAARPVLQGRATLLLRRDPLRETEGAAWRRPRRRSGDESALPLSKESEDLFQRLRALRAAIAREEGVPAYVIFHDRTLEAMAAARPSSERELLALHGVGARKLERFGARFLETLQGARECGG